MKSTRQYSSPEQEQIDKAICHLTRRCNLVSSIEPINAMEECTKFIELKGQYNPQFVYKPVDTNKIQQVVDTLIWLQKDFTAADPITQLQAKKVQELIEKYSLILAYQEQDFESIYKYNTRLFQTIPRDDEIPVPKYVPQISCSDYLQTDAYDTITTIDSEQAEELIHLKCKQLAIQNYQIVRKHIWSGSMTIQCEDVIKINLSTKKVFNKMQFAATLCHELDGHVMRYRNGLESGIALFAQGTWYYKATEEGVASYYKATILWIQDSYTHLGIMRDKCKYAMDRDWIQLCAWIQNTRKASLEQSFWMALRVKKWIQDTSIIHPGTVYQFDRVYLEWRSIVDAHIAIHGSIQNLMIGKICIDDVQLLA